MHNWVDITSYCNIGYISGTNGVVLKNDMLHMIIFYIGIQGSIHNQQVIATIGSLPGNSVINYAMGIGVHSSNSGISVNIRCSGANIISSHSRDMDILDASYLGMLFYNI